MTDNVIDLEARRTANEDNDVRAWMCVHCDSYEFSLLTNGEIFCAGCGTPVDNLMTFESEPPTPI